MGIMRETQVACQKKGKDNEKGTATQECHYALCYTAKFAQKRCDHIETGAGVSVATYTEDLNKLIKYHDVHCNDGGKDGKGRRNARFDCKDFFFVQFARRFPVSAKESGIDACISNTTA